MPEMPLLLGFGTNDWSDYWQTRQHVLSRLANRGFRVGYTTPALSIHERTRPRWQDARWHARREVLDGVRVMHPGRWPPLTHRVDAIDYAVMRRQARRFADYTAGRRGAQPDFAYVFHPQYLPYLEGIAARHVVYHADDNFGAMSAGDARLRALEHGLVERADLVFAITEGVADGLGERAAGKVVIVGNGAEVDLYGAAGLLPVPDDLAAIPRPVIGYAGSLNNKVDFPLVARLARARPGFHWALIGQVWGDEHLSAPLRAGLAECRRLPNVWFLGRKSYLELPAYCAHVDASAMLYRTDGAGWWQSIYPLKMHECLATGRPLLSSDLPAVRAYSDVVTLCTNEQEWLAALDAVAAGDDPVRQAARRSVARANSWDCRLDQIVAELRRLDG